MAQPATNPKIEELRFRLKADPKSRLFFPLAEELRKAGQVEEAEQVLRSGLVAHSTYLSAWVSLGRVLRDQKKDGEAVDALARALQLDPGNVVAARLLGDAHLSLGDKVEAIKKYKLVHALMPADEELQATIASLDRDLNPPAAAEPEALLVNPKKILEVGDGVDPIVSELDMEDRIAAAAPSAEVAPAAEAAAAQPQFVEESPFDRTMPPFEVREEEATGDAEPMYAAHEESPFEEPVEDYTAASMTVEAPAGMHIEEPPAAEGSNPKIARLEGWLSKVARKEGPNV
jgi:tetratricopeptide (TPR) repeat protein